MHTIWYIQMSVSLGAGRFGTRALDTLSETWLVRLTEDWNWKHGRRNHTVHADAG